jgi:MYXO-CTERM domain-containing protein
MFDFNETPLTEELILGASVHVVGFGVSDGTTQSGGGVQREIDLTVERLRAQIVGFGTPTRNICQGDSGGPTFFDADGDGNDEVIAVSSFGSNACMNTSWVARTDAFLDDFLYPILSSWDGECAGDGVCNEETVCDYPDPDCDICGFDGVCGSNCEQIDFDCPIATMPGGLCQDNDDCEFKLCAEAPDDPRVKYCTEVCDPNGLIDDECTIPLSTCVPGGGDNICGFLGPTPSTQGAECSVNEDCRSGVCDVGNRICVEFCASDAECAEPYSCVDFGGGNSVCTLGGDGGGCCSVGSEKDQWTGLFAAFFLGFMFLGARRRARRRRDS